MSWSARTRPPHNEALTSHLRGVGFVFAADRTDIQRYRTLIQRLGLRR
jgi:hypothetical protein